MHERRHDELDYGGSGGRAYGHRRLSQTQTQASSVSPTVGVSGRAGRSSSDALIGGQEGIRDFIAFPKNNSGRDVMLDAPSSIDDVQRKELGLASLL